MTKSNVEIVTTGLDIEERFDLLDVQAILTIMTSCWNDVFQEQLGYVGS